VFGRAGPRTRAYVGFLEAACELCVASAALRTGLSRRRRIALTVALLRLGEVDRALASTLANPERRRLEHATAGLDVARTQLVDAGRETAVDVARRRSIAPV
jgi:hypothetical protein